MVLRRNVFYLMFFSLVTLASYGGLENCNKGHETERSNLFAKLVNNDEKIQEKENFILSLKNFLENLTTDEKVNSFLKCFKEFHDQESKATKTITNFFSYIIKHEKVFSWFCDLIKSLPDAYAKKNIFSFTRNALEHGNLDYIKFFVAHFCPHYLDYDFLAILYGDLHSIFATKKSFESDDVKVCDAWLNQYLLENHAQRGDKRSETRGVAVINNKNQGDDSDNDQDYAEFLTGLSDVIATRKHEEDEEKDILSALSELSVPTIHKPQPSECNDFYSFVTSISKN